MGRPASVGWQRALRDRRSESPGKDEHSAKGTEALSLVYAARFVGSCTWTGF